MQIRITDDAIEIEGHSDTREHCAQVSSLAASVLSYVIDKLDEQPHAVIEDGYCIIRRDSLVSHDAQLLVDFLEHSLRELSSELPSVFRIV